MLVLGPVGTLGVAAWGLSTFRVVIDSKPLPSTMRSLVVDTGQLPVAVRITADRDTTEPHADMRMINSTRAGSHPLTVINDSANTRIAIGGEPSPFLQWGRTGEINVVLPPELARRLTVTSQQRTGVLMTQADLDQVTARMTHGAVLLSGDARRIEVDSVDGDVVARTAVAVTESFRATTANGDIEVDFKIAPRTLDANTDNGDIRIALPPRGPYVVNANTSDRSGDTVVRVPQTSDRKGAASVVTARSDTGDVTIDELS